MRNVIVGTSGHVDHGKTCLIKALTGTNTDRLKEEQKRGITIELGFANLPNDRGLRIGIIDVPGHEKFVKNMLAGIGGIDLVLLVVALDEGVMPQTVEHFEILKMLGIRQGIIVLTKADLVDEEWTQMVQDDVSALVEGSFLEHAPRICVSAHTGMHIPELKEMILDMVQTAGIRREEPELFRLPIDRIFTMEGFGTVITGTLIEGRIRTGDEVMVYPQGRILKVRGIENHGEEETEALAGQRTAINLAAVKKEELARGEVLAAPGTLNNSIFLDARVVLFQTAVRHLKNGSRVHFNYGSAQTIAKAVLLDADEIGPGERALVQFRFDEPVALKRGDRFIIRFFSPVETFGGGIILDAGPDKHKRGQAEVLNSLQILESGSESDVLGEMLRMRSRSFPVPAELALGLNRRPVEIEAGLEILKKKKTAVSLNDGSFTHMDFWKQIADTATELLKDYHRQNPVASGMERSELKNKLLDRLHIFEARRGDVLIRELEKRGVIKINANMAALADFETEYSDLHSSMRSSILEVYAKAGVEAVDMNAVLKNFQDKNQAKQVLANLINEGILIRLNPGIYLHRDAYERAMQAIRQHFMSHDTMSLAEFRDMMGTSRKYSQLFLEHCDQKKMTRMVGDVRILLK